MMAKKGANTSGRIEEALATECQRLAKEAGEQSRQDDLTADERRSAVELQGIYYQLAAGSFATALSAEKISPQAFTGRNQGLTTPTVERIRFLQNVSKSIGTQNRDAIAAEAVGKKYAKQAKTLWSGKLGEIETKVLNFMRNNAKNLGLTFED